MKRALKVVLGVTLMLLFAVAPNVPPIFAHHGFQAEYDGSKVIYITGTRTKLEWENPHAYFWVDAKDPSGKVTTWTFEGASPIAVKRTGTVRADFTANIGKSVTVRAISRQGRHEQRRCRDDQAAGRPRSGRWRKEIFRRREGRRRIARLGFGHFSGRPSLPFLSCTKMRPEGGAYEPYGNPYLDGSQLSCRFLFSPLGEGPGRIRPGFRPWIWEIERQAFAAGRTRAAHG